MTDPYRAVLPDRTADAALSAETPRDWTVPAPPQPPQAVRP